MQRSRGFLLRIWRNWAESAGSKRKRSSNGFVQLADPISDGLCADTGVYLVVEKLTGIEAPGDRQVSHSNKKAPDAGQQLQRGWKKLFQSPILRYAIILFLCWLPVFLAVYPGFFAYDATEELQEVLTGQYVTRHPLLHVLMLGKR